MKRAPQAVVRLQRSYCGALPCPHLTVIVEVSNPLPHSIRVVGTGYLLKVVVEEKTHHFARPVAAVTVVSLLTTGAA